jgi:hypothetical protein
VDDFVDFKYMKGAALHKRGDVCCGHSDENVWVPVYISRRRRRMLCLATMPSSSSELMVILLLLLQGCVVNGFVRIMTPGWELDVIAGGYVYEGAPNSSQVEVDFEVTSGWDGPHMITVCTVPPEVGFVNGSADVYWIGQQLAAGMQAIEVPTPIQVLRLVLARRGAGVCVPRVVNGMRALLEQGFAVETIGPSTWTQAMAVGICVGYAIMVTYGYYRATRPPSNGPGTTRGGASRAR